LIGPLLLAVSWILLRLEGRDLSALGFNRPAARARQFSGAFLFLGGVAAVQQLGLSFAAGDPFVSNPSLRSSALLDNLRFTVNSVLYEELVFRGYLLYLAIRFLGAKRAVLLDAVAFGIYHWFSYGAFGNPILMAYLLVMTGAMGLMWARAFAATGSVFAPVGFHFGWNVVSGVMFSAGPLAASLFVPKSGARQLRVGGWPSLALNVLLPLGAAGAGLCYYRRVQDARL
jgi:membrane protease YdiL (CAAX protease family)